MDTGLELEVAIGVGVDIELGLRVALGMGVQAGVEMKRSGNDATLPRKSVGKGAFRGLGGYDTKRKEKNIRQEQRAVK